ncbi:MAG: MFS transporter [Thermomicrobiales bacterium]
MSGGRVQEQQGREAGVDLRSRATGWRATALLPVLIYSAMVMSVLSTLGSPMIPTIAREKGVSLEAAQWVLTITLLVGAVTTPITGRLADGPWRKQTILGSLGLVFIGSVLAAAAPSFGVLMAGRALQGFGLGLVPLAISVARDGLSPDKVRGGIAILSVSTAIGTGLGYPITGLIAQNLDYTAAFWFAAVISVIAFALIALVVPSTRHQQRLPLDIVGAVLLSIALAALLLAISQGRTMGWASPQILGLFVVAVVAGVVWGMQALRTTYPLVNLRLMTNRSVLAADIVALMMGVSLYAMSSLVNRYVQAPKEAGYGFHAGLVATGLMLAPLSIGSLLSTRMSSWMTGKFGARWVLPIGSLIVALDMIFVGVSRSSQWEIVLAMAILGLGISTTFAAMPLLIIRAVPAAETGSATSMNTVLRSIGGAIGSAASIALLSAFTPAGSHLPSDMGYSVTFIAGAVICIGAAVVSLVMLPEDGDGGRVAAGAPVVTAHGNTVAAVIPGHSTEPAPAVPAAVPSATGTSIVPDLQPSRI